MTTRLLSTLSCALFLAASAAFAADAAANWDNHCSSCHGADGKGETKMGKKLKIRDLTDAAYQASFTDEDIFNAMKVGVKNAAGKVTMKAIEDISDDEMRELVTYVRSLKK
jgi:cytochrome c553